MAEDTRGWIVQPNPSATYTRTVTTTDDEGNPVEENVEDFGQPQWAYRRPGDHLMVFSGVSADDDPPSQTVQEAIDVSGFEEPEPDSVSAAAEVEARNQDQGTA